MEKKLDLHNGLGWCNVCLETWNESLAACESLFWFEVIHIINEPLKPNAFN